MGYNDPWGGNSGSSNGRNGRFVYVGVALLSLLVSLAALGKSVFFAGGETGRIEEHIRYMDMRLDQDEREFARRGEIQAEIDAMREIQRRQEQTLQEERNLIEEPRGRR